MPLTTRARKACRASQLRRSTSRCSPRSIEAEVVDNTSWSCAHGIERWRSDCGCNSGRQGWNQAWRAPFSLLSMAARRARAPLRTAAGLLFNDPWAARDEYIHVVLDRSEENPRGIHRANGRDARRGLRPSPAPSASSNSSATPCSCSPAVAGSSTISPASRPCRLSSTQAAWCSLPAMCSTSISKTNLSAASAKRRAICPHSGTAGQCTSAT